MLARMNYLISVFCAASLCAACAFPVRAADYGANLGEEALARGLARRYDGGAKRGWRAR
jgi:hypothetical protein